MGKTIVITAGGTSEYIDKVRKITNSGTGKLGSIIADRFGRSEKVEKIFYVHTPNAFLPKTEKAICMEVTNTNSVKKAVENLLTNNKIDVFIHTMAISDYYVDYVSTIEMLTQDICCSHSPFPMSFQVKNILNNPEHKLDNSSKLSSSEDNLVVVLKQTPKIIGMIKKLSPKTVLVGFKLLENVQKKYLLEAAENLLMKNNCDYVVANDFKDIKNGNHKAYLIQAGKDAEEMEGKEDIANTLAKKVL